MGSNKIKVMIVDDAAYFRFVLTKYLSREPDIEIVAAAKNGIEAIELIKKTQPDVITLDVEMPQMNGIEFLKYIMSTNPIPVIMLSSLSPQVADVTIKALQYGAVDFMNKEALNLEYDTSKSNKLLLEKVKVARTAQLKKLTLESLTEGQSATVKKGDPVSFKITKAQVIAIGSSTGGPKALHQLIPALPNDIPAGIIVVQHMPASFTRSLAARLNELSSLVVKEAEEGDLVIPGRVLVAPGDYHIEITKNFTVKLSKGAPVNHVRPSIDILFNSLVDVYGKEIAAVIMTGMGHDGANGAEAIRNAGGYIIAEDEISCTIFGMPKAVIDRQIAHKVLPLEKIHTELAGHFREKG